jgi:hypothetical protein
VEDQWRSGISGGSADEQWITVLVDWWRSSEGSVSEWGEWTMCEGSVSEWRISGGAVSESKISEWVEDQWTTNERVDDLVVSGG